MNANQLADINKSPSENVGLLVNLNKNIKINSKSTEEEEIPLKVIHFTTNCTTKDEQPIQNGKHLANDTDNNCNEINDINKEADNDISTNLKLSKDLSLEEEKESDDEIQHENSEIDIQSTIIKTPLNKTLLKKCSTNHNHNNNSSSSSSKNNGASGSSSNNNKNSNISVTSTDGSDLNKTPSKCNKCNNNNNIHYNNYNCYYRKKSRMPICR